MSNQNKLSDLAAKLGLEGAQSRTLPTKFATAFDDAAALPKHEVHMYNNAPLDSEPGRCHAPVAENANFDQKVYMFPESYNALRRELYEYWPNLFGLVGYAMAFDAVRFIELMDAALDTKTTFDSQKVDGTCKKYLDLLRNKRGLSNLHTAAEKA